MHAGARIGDYEILDEIGRGGMGRVYRVRNVISDRVEAMKVLLPSLTDDGDLAARFQREIRVLAALDHPNIAALRTAFRAGDELVMIMELIEGESLAQRVRRGALPVADAAACIDQALDALAYAHAQGVVHRDIKPANMMLTPDGVVKLTDFGIARSHADRTVTATGVTTGSLAYMSPEQVNGGRAEPRSDLYSLGISFYELVTGQPPFRAETNIALMLAHLQQEPSPPSEIQPALSRSLDELILRAIAKNPDDRFQSAADFRMALHAAMSGGLEQAERSTTGGAAAESTVLVPSRSTPAAPPREATPVPPPARPATAASLPSRPATAPEASRRPGLLAFVVVGVLVIAGLAWAGRYLRGSDAGSEAPAESTTAPQPVTTAGSAPVNPGEPSPAPVDPPGGGATGAVPAAASPETRAREPRTTGAPATAEALPAAAQQTRPADEPVAAPSPTPPVPPETTPEQATAELDRLETEIDRLLVRAGAVGQSLDVLVRQQAAQGVGLRADMAQRRLSMDLNLTRAQDALARGDAARARQYRDRAAADVQALERFLGR